MINKPEYLIIHHSGGTDANPLQDSSNYTVAMCNNDHKRFGMLSSLGYYVGYHYIIEKNGKVTQCRADNEDGAHTIGYNSKSIGIMLCGNFDATLPTAAQEEALKTLMLLLIGKHSIALENIVPHRKFANKTCFGKKLSDTWARDLLKKKALNPEAEVLLGKISEALVVLSDLLEQYKAVK